MNYRKFSIRVLDHASRAPHVNYYVYEVLQTSVCACVHLCVCMCVHVVSVSVFAVTVLFYNTMQCYNISLLFQLYAGGVTGV